MLDEQPVAAKPAPQPFEKIGEVVSIFQRGQVWWANFQYGRKQRRQSLKTVSKKEARRRALLLEADLLQHRYQPDHKPPTIQATVDAHMENLEAEGRAAKTLGKYTKVFGRVVELGTELSRADLLGIDMSFIDAFRKRRTDAGCAPKTIYNELTIIKQLINFARSRNLILTDPLAKLKLKKPKPTPQPCWSPAESERILTNSRGRQQAAFTLLADSGMRVGELRWLTWADVDWQANVLHVRPKPGWKPKSGDQRAIPMTSRVKQLCEALPRTADWVLSAGTSRKHPEGGGQLSERRLLRSLKRLLKRLGLPGHLHTFRHSFISKSLMAGIPEAVVRSWVGHVDREIMKLYTHIADAASQAAMRKFTEAQHIKRASGKDAEEQHDA